MTTLTDLLPPAAIDPAVRVGDWREAVRAAGGLLERTGAADHEYTEEMVRTVEEYGPYIVIAPGFALAHARPAESVHHSGMSLVRLTAPVTFGHESNDPVTTVAGLAATDSSQHQDALAGLARALSDPRRKAALEAATTPDEVLAALADDRTDHVRTAGAATGTGTGTPAAGSNPQEPTVASKNLLLTVCGNGLGTSLFLKNTAEQVLDDWGWSAYLGVEATDTISAKGRAGEADAMLTSRAIAQTLGDVGVAVEVIDDFTSKSQVDAALRRIYAV